MITEIAQSTSIHLQPATEEDRNLLRQIYASTRLDELKFVDWTDEEKSNFVNMQFHAQDVHYRKYYPDASFNVIMLAHQPAGRLFVDRGSETIRVIDITLLPEFRGKGIGTQLLRELFDESDRTGIPVSIHVECYNPARKLYRRLGFQPVELKGIYWRMERKPFASELTTLHDDDFHPLELGGDQND